MRRCLQTLSTALALFAVPGCANEVIIPDDAPVRGIFNVQQNQPDAFPAVLAGARFVRGGSGGATSTEIGAEGGCRSYQMKQGLDGNPGVAVDVGKLRVTGKLADLTADFEGGYEFFEKGPIFEAGDPITFGVEGSDLLPALSVTLPGPPIPVLAPPPATIARDEDLVFTWQSPAGTGTLNIDVAVFGDWIDTPSGPVRPSEYTIDCKADVATGTLTVPASLLSLLPAAGTMDASISASVNNGESRQDEGYSVWFVVGTTAVGPEGKAYFFNPALK